MPPADASQPSVRREPAEWARSQGLIGHRQPRLATDPLRKLTRATSRGFEVVDFADQVLGEPLLPWQQEAVIRGLELLPDGTYRFRTLLILVARQNGKTHLSRCLALWRLYLDGARLVLGVGQDVSLAREVWQGCIDTIQSVPDLAAELDTVRRVNGDEWFRLTGGARYKIAAANRSAGRGLSVDQLHFDELREQRSWLAWSALSKTTQARTRALTICLTNAGDDQSVVLNHLREAALAGADPSVGILEWSAADGCALDDPEAWAAANPALGHTISEIAIRSSLATDPPAVFRTEVLCQRVQSLDEAIDLAAWHDGADATGNLDAVRDQVVVGLDVAPDGGHVALDAAAVLPDGRVRVEVVAAWRDTKTARAELSGILARVKPRALAWFPSGPAAALAPVLRGLKGVEVVELKGGDVTAACMGFADLVTARRIVHGADALLDAHAAGAQRLHVGEGWRFMRRGAGHVSALYAAAGAVHVALTVPVKPRVRPQVIVPRSAAS